MERTPKGGCTSHKGTKPGGFAALPAGAAPLGRLDPRSEAERDLEAEHAAAVLDADRQLHRILAVLRDLEQKRAEFVGPHRVALVLRQEGLRRGWLHQRLVDAAIVR